MLYINCSQAWIIKSCIIDVIWDTCSDQRCKLLEDVQIEAGRLINIQKSSKEKQTV